MFTLSQNKRISLATNIKSRIQFVDYFFYFFPNEERIDDESRISIIQQLKTKNKKTRNIGEREETKNE